MHLQGRVLLHHLQGRAVLGQRQRGGSALLPAQSGLVLLPEALQDLVLLAEGLVLLREGLVLLPQQELPGQPLVLQLVVEGGGEEGGGLQAAVFAQPPPVLEDEPLIAELHTGRIVIQLKVCLGGGVLHGVQGHRGKAIQWVGMLANHPAAQPGQGGLPGTAWGQVQVVEPQEGLSCVPL